MPPPHTILGFSLQHTVFTNGISSDVKKTLSTTVLSPSAEVHLNLHDVPLGSKKWTITADRAQAALKELPLWQIMNENQLLHHVVSSKRLNEWLTSKINEIEQDYGFLVLGRPVWADRFTPVPAVDYLRNLEFSYQVCPNVPEMRNLPTEHVVIIQIHDPIAEALGIEYNGDNRTALRFECRMSVKAIFYRPWVMGSPTIQRAPWIFPYEHRFLSFPLPIRLEILKCWLTGRDENPAKGIKISRSDNESIQYPGSPNYPVKLFHLIRDLGPNGLKRLFEFGCLGPETYHVITHRLAEMEDDSSGELGLHETGRFPGVGSKNISASRDEILEEHGLNNDDVDKLKTVEKNQERFLSARKWARELGFASSSAPSAFFERMEKNGLLISSKGPDGEGIRAKLTDEGKRLTRLF